LVVAAVVAVWNEEVIPAGVAGARAGLQAALEFLLAQAERIVPLETGQLASTGSVTVEGLRGAVAFSGPYSVFQHERLDLRHAPGRMAKYLEIPAQLEAATMGELIAAAVRRALV
jgi:hypothetical protein